MTIELKKAIRDEAVASIQAYSETNFHERLGNIAAGGSLDFVLEEIGPSIYNMAVADVQRRLQIWTTEIDLDLHQTELPHSRAERRKA